MSYVVMHRRQRTVLPSCRCGKEIHPKKRADDKWLDPRLSTAIAGLIGRFLSARCDRAASTPAQPPSSQYLTSTIPDKLPFLDTCCRVCRFRSSISRIRDRRITVELLDMATFCIVLQIGMTSARSFQGTVRSVSDVPDV